VIFSNYRDYFGEPQAPFVRCPEERNLAPDINHYSYVMTRRGCIMGIRDSLADIKECAGDLIRSTDIEAVEIYEQGYDAAGNFISEEHLGEFALNDAGQVEKL
jgi:hypothetical protein